MFNKWMASIMLTSFTVCLLAAPRWYQRDATFVSLMHMTVEAPTFPFMLDLSMKILVWSLFFLKSLMVSLSVEVMDLMKSGEEPGWSTFGVTFSIFDGLILRV